MRKSLHLSWIYLRKSLSDIRFYLALLWIFTLDYSYVRQIRMFAANLGLGVTPWLFPFLIEDPGNQFFVILGAVILFCDAPFLNASSCWQIARSGRSRWFYGNLFYMMELSFLYSLSIAFIPVLILIPQVAFSWKWGQVIGTLAQTDAAMQIGIANLNYSVIVKYTPVQAMGFALLSVFLNTVLIAVVNYTFNLWTKRGTGALISMLIGLSPMMIKKLIHMEAGYYLSPPCWMNIGNYNWDGYGVMPSMTYIYGAFAVLILSGIVLSYVGVKRKDLNFMEEA